VERQYKKSDKEPEVSVLVTSYNIEEYIEECICSIFENQGTPYEVIVVDDGSSDATRNVLERLAIRFPLLQIVKQDNQGVTKARINGLLHAKGNYVVFVDGDDYVLPDMLRVLMDAAAENGADVILNQAYIRKSGNQEDIYESGIDETMCHGREELKNFLWDDETGRGILPNLWGNLYRKSVALKAMQEMPQDVRYAEDEMFLWSLLHFAETIKLIRTPIYVYRHRANSVCNTRQTHFLRDLDEKYNYLYNLYFDNPQIKKQLAYKTVHELMSLRFLDGGAIEFHMFPYQVIPGGRRIILYGAGQVGQSYYRQIEVNHYCEIVAWCDSRFEVLGDDRIIGIQEALSLASYDYILIAILNERMAEHIKQELVDKQKVDEKKVVTYQPLPFVNYLNLL